MYTCFKATCDEKKCPTDSVPYIPSITVITPGPITINEGQEGVMIEIEVSLPPRFLCAASEAANTTDSECILHIMGSVSVEGPDLTCLESAAFIPQAVLGLPPTYDSEVVLPCGLKVTQLNWFFRLQIIVKATIDGVVDGDISREVTITQSIVVEETVLVTGYVIGTVQVSISLSY